jgi:hypothetical protein
MITIETISIVFTGLSISFAAFYYINTLRNQSRARKIEMFMRLYENRTSTDVVRRFFTVMQSNWEDYDDYLQKYDSTVNPEHAAVRNSHWAFYEGLGLLLRDGLIDRETVYTLQGVPCLLNWFKWETVIVEIRKGTLGDDWMENFEYLADEMIRMRQERGKKLPVELLHPTSTLIERLTQS